MSLGVTLCDGQFEVQGQSGSYIPLRCGAWFALVIAELAEYGDRTGADRRLPRGVIRPYRRRPTSRELSLPFDIVGDVVPQAVALNNPAASYTDLVEVTDPNEGWKRNYDFLVAELIADPGTTAGTRAARFTDALGSVKTADVHMLAIPVGTYENGTSQCTLELTVIGGRFT